jgi:hypothetical protein
MRDLIVRCVGATALDDAFQPIVQLPVYARMTDATRHELIHAWQAQFVAHVTMMLTDLVPDYIRPRVQYWRDRNRLDLVVYMIGEHVEGIEMVVRRELDITVEQLIIAGMDKNL